MRTAQQELEELLVELERVESKMLAMQYRVALLRRATREVRQPATTPDAGGRTDREALREATERLQRLSTEKSRARKRTLH